MVIENVRHLNGEEPGTRDTTTGPPPTKTSVEKWWWVSPIVGVLAFLLGIAVGYHQHQIDQLRAAVVQTQQTITNPAQPGPSLGSNPVQPTPPQTPPNTAADTAFDGGSAMSWCQLQRGEPRNVCLLRIVTEHSGTTAAIMSADLIRDNMIRQAQPRSRPAARHRRR